MPTDRLYYDDAELLEFDAMAVAHYQNDPRQVLLDRTAFYPTSGGQPHDIGTLNGIRVVDVTDVDDLVIHHLAEPLALGAVHGVIDAARRHDHMQQHTAQHLISALAADRLKWPTTSVHFGAESSAIEFATTSASQPQLDELEAWANQIVGEARQVAISFENPSEAIAKGLRTPPAREGVLRVISITGLDRSACGGTHVSQTAAIGPIRLLGNERVRGQVRISFLAGERTLRHLRDRDALVDTVSKAMSCAASELTYLIPKRMREMRDMKERLEELQRRAASARLQQLIAATAPGHDGIRRVVDRGEEGAVLRVMAQAAGAMDRVMFAGLSANPPGLVIGTSADSGMDAGAMLKAVMTQVGGKGGGSARLAQGSLPSQADLADTVRMLTETIGA